MSAMLLNIIGRSNTTSRGGKISNSKGCYLVYSKFINSCSLEVLFPAFLHQSWPEHRAGCSGARRGSNGMKQMYRREDGSWKRAVTVH